MVYYNLTNATTAINLATITQEVNKLSGDALGIMTVMGLFIILFVAFRNYSIRVTMPIVFFLVTLLSILLAILQLIPDFVVYILIIATAGTVVASIFINPEG